MEDHNSMEEHKTTRMKYTQADLKTKIAQLRTNYGRLRVICGPQAISKATVEEYAKKLRELEAQLN